MNVKRGDVWLADLNPIRGSEEAGTRPILIFQNDVINKFTSTVLAVPFTTNLRRALLSSCVQVSEGEGGLTSDSVALCHQLRVLDKTRLIRKLGEVRSQTLSVIESCIKFTTGMT